YIHSIPKFNRVLGNALLEKLLNKMGNPQDNLKFIHIGGTNGKGSTCTMVSQILTEAGYKTGLFTSPFLKFFNERIKINGIPISNSDLADIASYVKNMTEKYDAFVSEFAFDTAVAFEYFNRQNCDFVILEVGLGGKLDATNIIKNPLVVGFTAIGLDHCQYLGNTIDEISKEKAGIIKKNSDVVLYPIQESKVFDNIRLICQEKNSNLIIPELPTLPETYKNSFEYKGTRYDLTLNGRFQTYNAVTAIEIINSLLNQGYAISSGCITNSLKHANIEGRFEFIAPNIIVDGAHNPQAINSFLKSLKNLNKKIHFLVAFMSDKDYESIINLISDYAISEKSKITATEINMPRCLDSGTIKNIFMKNNIVSDINSNPISAFNEVVKTLHKDELLCIIGSLFLAGEIKKYYEEKNS
ncbi:MAG: bifunctional folylpolyglutamate synthase/dihydrofolate synthase, partial [Monoglobus pectinilyticus]